MKVNGSVERTLSFIQNLVYLLTSCKLLFPPPPQTPIVNGKKIPIHWKAAGDFGFISFLGLGLDFRFAMTYAKIKITIKMS